MERWGIPPANDKRIAVHITKDAERHLRAGHPWLFDAAITSLSHEGAAGDLAVVFDQDRKFLAIGLYDPDSPMRVRVLHSGKPATIDAAWWAARIDAALAIREPLGAVTDAYRCINGENDGFGGLVLDRYGSVLVLKVYSVAWFPHLPLLVELLVRRLHPSSVVVRTSRSVAGRECFGLDEPTALVGVLPDEPVPFHEHGLAFEADVVEGQKTGWFLDQRENRGIVGDMSAGRTVLDVFCCTGGFSVHAAAGGATSVHSVDVNPHAIASTERSMAMNGHVPAVAACRHTTQVGDAFEALRRAGGRGESYGLVVVDPPSFAHRQSDIDKAISAYRALTQLALGVLRPGGVLVQSSCSSRVTAEAFVEAVTDAAWQASRQVRLMRQTGHDIDHPVTFAEGAYLKTVYLEVVR